MVMAKVVKTMNNIPYTDRFHGVCLAFKNDEKRNVYLVVRCKLGDEYKYKVAPIFNKYSNFNSEKYYTKNEILENFLVISTTKPKEVQSLLTTFFMEELNEETD